MMINLSQRLFNAAKEFNTKRTDGKNSGEVSKPETENLVQENATTEEVSNIAPTETTEQELPLTVTRIWTSRLEFSSCCSISNGDSDSDWDRKIDRKWQEVGELRVKVEDGDTIESCWVNWLCCICMEENEIETCTVKDGLTVPGSFLGYRGKPVGCRCCSHRACAHCAGINRKTLFPDGRFKAFC